MGVMVSESRLVCVIVLLRLLIISSIIVFKETKVLFGVVVMRRLALSVVMILPLVLQ